MKRTLLAVAAVCALSSGAAFAQQAEGPWMVRVRAVNLDSANKDSTGLGLSINNKWMPEVDVSYFFTPNIAAELVLTYPQKHDLRANGLARSAASSTCRPRCWRNTTSPTSAHSSPMWAPVSTTPVFRA
jgi:outer membrane protein